MLLNGRKIGLDQPIFLIAGPCVTLDRMEALLTTLVDLDRTVKEAGFEEMAL